MSYPSDTIDVSTTERNKMAEYQVIVYGWITADSLEEAEEIYESGDWFPDYHEIEDEDGQKYDQWDIERLSNVS